MREDDNTFAPHAVSAGGSFIKFIQKRNRKNGKQKTEI